MNTNNRSTAGIETEYDSFYEAQKVPFTKSRLPAKPVEFLKGGDVISRFSEEDSDSYGLDEDLDEAAKNELCSFVFKNVVGYDYIFRGPFGRNVVTYMDYIASGRSLKCIETYIARHVMPTYANTHTEMSHFAQQTNMMREEARSIIKKCVNANDDDALIFTGTGATTAIHKIIHAMDIKKATVLIGPFEHHSNILPWREMNCKIVRIRQNRYGTVDMEHLEEELKLCDQRLCGIGETTVIGSFSAASNVTGILVDTNAISAAIHRHNGIVMYDYACAGPYVNIDMNPLGKKLCYKDAIFLSCHKFIGGPQTPGLLVAKRWLFKNKVPHGAGGGTVSFVTRKKHHYHKHVEHREEGGTPGIIEAIRAGLVFKLKHAFGPNFIMEREAALFRLAAETWSLNPRIVILGSLKPERLPIFPMLFFNEQTGRFVHHDFIALILNDLFGIQVRSGCACAAPYGMDLLGINHKTGNRLERFIIDVPDADKGNLYEQGEYENRRPKNEDDDEPPRVIDHDGPVNNTNTNRPKKSPSHEDSHPTRNVIFKPGFVRLNFPFFITEDCFDFIIRAVEMVADRGWTLLPLYQFDRDTGGWYFADKSKKFHNKKSLRDITFAQGRFDIRSKQKAPLSPIKIGDKSFTETQSPTESVSFSDVDDIPAFNYQEILDRAEQIFHELSTPGKFVVPDTTSEYTGEGEKLRWFMLPCEASNIINGQRIKTMRPEDRPVLPAIFNMSEASDSILQSLTGATGSDGSDDSDTSLDSSLYSAWETTS